MATKYKIKTPENTHVHFVGAPQTGVDYTLCGLECSVGGDPKLGIGSMKWVNARVNCPSCIAIVTYCHAIKKSEF